MKRGKESYAHLAIKCSRQRNSQSKGPEVEAYSVSSGTVRSTKVDVERE